MKVYLDARVLVALLTADPLTARADAFLRAKAPVLVLSDFASAEFASAVARRVRTRDITKADARAVFATLDSWAIRTTERIETTTADVRGAEAFLRRLDLTLRTPDALNIAIAQRAGAALATFDEKMATAARALGAEVASA
jgi:uncharacterized protein